MPFTTKSFLPKKSRYMRTTFRYLTMFFFGMSCVLFAVRAFNITPITTNAIIYIKTIFLTRSGSNLSMTGIVLEWSWGYARFKDDITVDSLHNVPVIGNDPNGKLIVSSAQSIYNYISWYVGTGWNGSNNGWGGSLWKTGANNVLTPKQIGEVKFQVGSGSVSDGAHAIVMGQDNLVDVNSSHASIVGWNNNLIQNSDDSFIWWWSGNQIVDANN